MLALAAATLERTQSIRLRALGLDKDNAPPYVMPELIIRDLSKEEITALAEHDESDEDCELGIPIVRADGEIDESDDIIVEGDTIDVAMMRQGGSIE